MARRKNNGIPRRLARAAVRFTTWRRMHVPHTPIPKALWNAAARLGAEFGISRTATRLRLNYNDLKKHVEATAPPSVAGQPSFVELPAAALAISGDCVIELENTVGCTMRIQIKGSHCPDLVALSTAFCNAER